MSKITDMLISALLKRGVLYEARNCDVEFDMPSSQDNAGKITIKVKIDHMTLKVENKKEEC